MVLRRTAPLWAGLLLVVLSACGTSVAPSVSDDSADPQPGLGSTGYDPCGIGDFSWQGAYAAEATSFPSVLLDPAPPDYVATNVPASFAGTILRPADTARYPGKRPAIVIEHGEGGDQCNLWWLAHAMAGAGYVALVFTQPVADPLNSQGVNMAAMISGVAFIESAQNPFAAYTDITRIGLAGHSEGATSASYIQGIPAAASVHAIVALDNLKHYLQGDPGSALVECATPQKYPVTPLVPALGFALDHSCLANPLATKPDVKEGGWSWWMQAMQPSVELVMAGYSHFTFTDVPLLGGDSQQLQTLSFFIQAWFDHWLGGSSSADQQLLACSVNGQNTVDLLSSKYLSGVYLPDMGLLEADYRAHLMQNCS